MYLTYTQRSTQDATRMQVYSVNLSNGVMPPSSKNPFIMDTWLSRYLLPEKVLTDGGPEFSGHEWEFMLNDWGLKRARISSHTPTANAVIESSHRSMGQILRTIFDRENPTNMDEMDKVVRSALAATMHALRCASSTSLQGVAPGALVFGRDMLLNIPIVTDII